LKSDITEAQRDYANEFMFQAMDNFAGLYKDLGDFQKAKVLINYSYQQKRKILNPDSPEISKGKILLGQINLSLKNYSEAETFINEGISEFTQSPSNFHHWLADGYYTKAIINRDTNQLAKAFECYQQSEDYFKLSSGDYYDEIYLDFINSASSFYAENGYPEKALAMAKKAYDYITANQGAKTLLEYNQMLNLATINYTIGNYETALIQSNEALELLNHDTFTKNTNLGRLTIECQKPAAMLIKVKSQNRLQEKKDSIFLKSQLTELQKAIGIIEEQKSIILDDHTISILLTDNSALFEYSKTLALELYTLTNSKKYLHIVLGLHESMLYNRIRNRLNSKASIRFANIPQQIIEKEQQLKRALTSSILENDALDSFFKASKDWDAFSVSLKREYPKYYNLKYASISKSIGEQLESQNLNHKTVIRYTFIDQALYAFVVNKNDLNIVKLNSLSLPEKINAIQASDGISKIDFAALHELYVMLWKPLESKIGTKNLVIIPDQILFNLNFEMLSKKPVISYGGLSKNCLLNDYIVSYNYSLFLIEDESKTIGFDKNFIGFAPEFNSKMKTDYTLKIKDSITMDRTYLTLLPQPFSKNLAQNSSKFFTGESFINEKASKQLFTQHAKEHKIIHIGTHAESNNVSPELSRLIFAKNVKDSMASEDNSLYTYEIYNQNLSSNLAILTACETGKPTYQAGEGMISLAHAFNYAGSESILTSLWKIDEQSSAAIIENFYGYIKDGLPKDEALQKAKLDYIATAKGRTLSPQYWAGLVLIGDTLPIHLTSTSYFWYWMLGGLLVIFFLLVLLIKIKRSASH
jgi:CHAT domain-containing protein